MGCLAGAGALRCDGRAGIQFEGFHRIEYNVGDGVLVFFQYPFGLRSIFPHDNTPFLVDLDETLIIPKTPYSSGLCCFLPHYICCDFEVRKSR